MRVLVLGAGGGIGQPMSMLLKMHLPPKSDLILYDLTGVNGVAVDLSHIDTEVNVSWAQGTIPPTPHCPELSRVAKLVDVVILCAGLARKPGMSRDDLFKINAEIVLDLVTTVALQSPHATYGIITNPVNSLVPIAAEGLKKLGCYNRDKVFGVTTLDVVRATTFINEQDSTTTDLVKYVPVVGGHSGSTIVPLFSQIPGGNCIPADKVKILIERVQNAGTEVVNAKAGKGSATLSMAVAGARFTLQIVKALVGESTVSTFAFVDVRNEILTTYKSICSAQTEFLAIPLTLGTTGIIERLPIGPISGVEADALKVAVVDLNANIDFGISWARSKL